MRYEIAEPPVGEYGKGWLSAQTKQEMPIAALNRQLLILRTGFRNAFKDYTDDDFRCMQSLWYEVFKNIPEELFSEAITRFICTERKGFPPSVGQIIGCVEQILEERENNELLRRIIVRDGIYTESRQQERGATN